jgi:hypothetical protein
MSHAAWRVTPARRRLSIAELVYGWLDALGVTYDVSPDVSHCTMHHDGTCVRDIRITLST